MSGEFDAPEVQLAEAPATPPAPPSAPPPAVTNEYDALIAQGPAAATAPAGNEYDGLVVDLGKERQQRLRAVGVSAQGSTPEAAAKSLDLSRKTGLPPDLVERNLPKVESDHKLNEYEAVLAKSPRLGDWLLADPINAKVAGDEIERLAKIEAILRPKNLYDRNRPNKETRAAIEESVAFEANLYPSVGGFSSSSALEPGQYFIGGLRRGVETMGQGFNSVARVNDLNKLATFARIDSGEAVPPTADPEGYGDMTPAQRAETRTRLQVQILKNTILIDQSQKYAKDLPRSEKVEPLMGALDAIAFDKDFLKTTTRAFDKFLEAPGEIMLQLSADSAAFMLPTIAGSLLGPVGTFMGSALPDYATRFDDILKDKIRDTVSSDDQFMTTGLDPNDPFEQMRFMQQRPELMKEAQDAAWRGAVVTGVADMVTMGLARPIRAGATIRKNAQAVSMNLVREVGMEGAQEATARWVADQNWSTSEVISEMLGAGPMTAASTAKSSFSEYVADRNNNAAEVARQEIGATIVAATELVTTLQTHVAEQGALSIDDLIEKVQASKLNERSPDKMREFLETVLGAEEEQTVFVPANVVATYMQDMTGIERPAFLERLGITEQQIERARVSKEDIAIPLPNYVMNVGEAHKAWRDDIRTEVEGFSVNQAKDYEKTRTAETQAIIQRFEEGIAAGVQLEPRQIVQDKAFAQLKEMGLPTRQAASNAALLAGHANAMATLEPTKYADALDFYEKHPIRFESENTRRVRELAPDRLDILLDSIRSGKDPLSPPVPDAHVKARADAAALELTSVLGPGPEKTPAQIAKENRKAAQELFKADRENLAGMLAEMGVDPKGMSNDAIRSALEGAASGQGRTFDQVNVNSAAFKAWFGDSKVVDADGKPLVVYHGTNKAITKFALSKAGSGAWTNKYVGEVPPNLRAIFMTSDEGHASAYGENVMPLYVSLQNPMMIDAAAVLEAWRADEEPEFADAQELIDEGYDGSLYQAINADGLMNDAILDARKNGHDGVIVDFGDLTGSKAEGGSPGKIVIAFEPEQIKSINNRGTFDPNDARILYQEGVSEDRADKIAGLLQRSAEAENQPGVVVGGLPGRLDWSFDQPDGVPPPIQHPTQRGPRIEKIAPAVLKILKTKGFRDLATELTGASNITVTPIAGTWEGNRKPSYVIQGEGLTDEGTAVLARLMGFAFAQDAVIQVKHSPDFQTGAPTLYIGNGKALQADRLDEIIRAARVKGLDLSTSADGKAVKFLYFGNEAGLEAFYDAVSTIATEAGFPAPVSVNTEGERHAANGYRLEQIQRDGASEGRPGSGAGRPDLFRRAVDHLIVPYAKAVGAEGYRFSPDRFAERFGLTDEERELLREKLLPKNGTGRATVPLMTGEETIEVVPTTVRGKKGKLAPNINDAMWALQNRSAALGLIEPGDYSSKAMRLISQAIAAEIKHHIDTSEKSAVGWYDAALKRAKEAYREIFPEIFTDPDKAMLFDAVLGITSQGNDVHSNSLFAARTYKLLRDGKPSGNHAPMDMADVVETLKGTFGAQTRAIETNLLKLDHLLKTNSYDHMRKLFNQKMTVGEWNARLRSDPKLKGPEGETLSAQGAAVQNVTGWMVFGPKIGSFINNLHGDYSTLTADLWFSRTWNRVLGYMFLHSPSQEASQYQDFKDALLAEWTQSTEGKTSDGKVVMKDGKPVPWLHGTDVAGMSIEDMAQLSTDPDLMLALAVRLEEGYRKGGYKDKSDLRRRAKNWIENREDSVQAPRGDLERHFQQQTMEAAQALLKKGGVDITIADMQAAIWYYEKDLFKHLGVNEGRAAPADYADAAHQTIESFKKGDLYYRKTDKDYIGGGPRTLYQSLDQEARGSITFDNTGALVRTFAGRDPSTVLHELWHYFHNNLEFMARAPDASSEVKAMYQATLDYAGVKGGNLSLTPAEWDRYRALGDKIKKSGKKSLDGGETAEWTVLLGRVEQNEVVARAGEAFLLTGKSPSEALASAFRAFKNWLITVYRSVKRLNVPVSAEFDAVMAQMIATREEIEAAQNRQGLNPVLGDAKNMLTEAERDAYTKRAEQVLEEADDKVRAKVMAPLRRAAKSLVDDVTSRIKGEVTAEAMKDPGNAALYLLRNGKLFGSDDDAKSLPIKLSRPALVAIVGEDGLKNLPSGIHADDGMDLTTVAQMVGLGNGQELVERLMQVQTDQKRYQDDGGKGRYVDDQIHRETHRRVLEEIGDPLNDGSLEKEVEDAIRSDKQGALMAFELKVLARKAGHSGVVSLEDITAWADGAIAEMSQYQAVQFAKYQRAERTAGIKVQQALLKGDIVAAFKAKQDQLVNFALYKAAKKAAEDTDKITGYLDKLAGARTIKALDQDYLDTIHEMLEEYDFKRRSGPLLAERTLFNAYKAEQLERGVVVQEPPRLKGAERKHFSQMSMEELRDFYDTIKQIDRLGRKKKELFLDGKKRELEATLTEMEAAAAAGVQRGSSLSTRGLSDLEKTVGKPKHWLRVMNAELLKVERLLEFADGDKTGRGIFTRMIYRPVADAAAATNDRRIELGKKQKAIYEKVPEAQRHSWAELHVLPELGGIKLDKEAIIAIALNMGNASNLEKMLLGEKWSEDGVRAAVNKHLTQEEWTFVQDMWDLIDSQWPEAAAMIRDVEGVEPPKIEAVPLQTPYGTLKGGYYPVEYARNESLKGDKVGEMQDSALLVGMAPSPRYGRPSSKAGSTNARTEFNAPFNLSLSVIGKHLDEITHDIFHRRAVADIFKIVSNDRFREAIRSRLGAEYEKVFMPWLKRVANEARQNNSDLRGWDSAMKTLRVNVTMMAMGLRVSTMVQQVAGYANSLQRLGSKDMLAGMAEFWPNPGRAAEQVYALSGEMRHRANNLERDVKANLDKFRGKSTWKASLGRFAFRGIALADLSVSIPTWLGAYRKGLADGFDEADAISYADKMVRDTQGAGGSKDLSSFQDGSETWKIMGMFYSFLNVFYNAQQGIVEDARKPNKSFSDYADIAWQVSMLMIVSPIMAALLSGQGPDDEEDKLYWAMRQAGFGAFSGIPIVRDLMGTLSRELGGKPSAGFKMSPVAGPLEGSIRLVKDLTNLASGEEVSKNFVKNTFNVVGGFAGLPTGQIGVTSQFLWDSLISGAENPENLLDWMRGMSFGPKK